MKMKDSGIEWIGEIPEKWKSSKVKRHFSRKKSIPETLDFHILKLARSGVEIRDISTGEGQIASDYTKYNPVEPLDILINPMDLISGDNCNVSLISGVISPAYFNIRVKGLNNPFYFNYYFKLQYWIGAFFTHGKGVSFDNRWTINDETMQNFPLIVPPIKEQTQIANFLDDKVSKIDAIITDTKESIEALKAYKQSVITETVTKGLNPDAPMKDSGVEWLGKIPVEWSYKKMKHIAKVRKEKSDYQRGDKFLALENMESYKPGYISLNIDVDEGQQSVIKKGDLIFNRLRPYLAKTAISDFEGFGTGELLIIKDMQVESQFLMYKLISHEILNAINASMYGTKMPRVNADFIMNLPISFPSKENQIEIVKYISSKMVIIEKLIQEKEQLITEYEAYKKSLIYEYVTGKKRVGGEESAG